MGVISPRFDVGVKVIKLSLSHNTALIHLYQDIEQLVQNILLSRGFGHIVLTTTFGIMDHDDARKKKTGGKILGFFY